MPVLQNGETTVNNRTKKLGATLGAFALALAAPAVASAQSSDAPDTSMPSTAYSAPAGSIGADQLDRLQSLGFINQSEVLTAQVDANSPAASEALSSSQLDAALDNVKVEDAEGITWTLGEFLHSQGIDTSTIVGVNVSDNAVVIAHT